MNEPAIEEEDKPEDLILAEQLIEENKYSDAINVLIKLEKQENIPLHQKISVTLIQARMLMFLGKYEESIKVAEKAYEESSRVGENLKAVEALNLIALVNNWQGEFDESYELIKKSEELFKTITKESSVDYIRVEANLNHIKGYLISLNDADKGLEYLEYSLSLWDKIDWPLGKAMTLMCIGLTLYNSKGELDNSIMYLEQALKITMDNNNKFGTAFVLSNLGNSYSLKGDINKTLTIYQETLKLYTEINNKPQIANLYCYIGELMQQKGDSDQALKYIEKALEIYEELGPSLIRGFIVPLSIAFEVSIEKKDINLANEYLNRLKQINLQLNYPIMDLWISFYDSLILKKSSRTRDKAKAEELMKSILGKVGNERFSLTISILINLCELYLTELHSSNNLEVLDDIHPLINKLLDIAKNSHSYLILCETYILQAKLALISLEVKEARKYLTQAQQIAKKYGMDLLAIKISNEHDELLKQLNIWEEIKESETPLSERIKLAKLNEQMGRMIHKEAIEPVEISSEEPIIVLIVSEGGVPVFSQSFDKEWKFEEHLFGSFLTAINSFSDEVFSQGLDRAKFGKYNLLMKLQSPFLICYLYKGPTYIASLRIEYFIENIQKDISLWETFNKYLKINKLVELKDIPSIKPLINDLFIERNIKLAAEQTVTVQKDKKICLICRGEIIGYMYNCSCDAIYCENCARTLTDLENVCWACGAPLDTSKPIKSYEDKEKIKIDQKRKK
ncbi:MAG: tetratricopeptide repeat protein [Promethearchaeota archaeon]